MACIAMAYTWGLVKLDISHVANHFRAFCFNCNSNAGVLGTKAASHFNAVTRSLSLTSDFNNFALPHGEHGSILWANLGHVGSATNNGSLSVSG